MCKDQSGLTADDYARAEETERRIGRHVGLGGRVGFNAESYPCLVVSKGGYRLIGTAVLSDGRYSLVKREPGR